MTLSQYATKPSNYFESNTTLILLPGNHILDTIMTFSRLYHVEILGNTTVDHYTTVSCTNGSWFDFHNINSVSIGGLLEFGCGPNSFLSLTELTLEDCVINGEGFNSTGVVIEDVLSATITGTRFSSNRGIELTVENQPFAMGALAILNSSVSISNCLFDYNMANQKVGFGGMGGAIYTTQSTVILYNSTFISNQAQNGGVLLANANVHITILFSEFFNNVAGSTGGVIFAQTFCEIRISNSIFESNIALSSSGVINAESGTTVVIQNSKFQNNGAQNQGGVIQAYYQCTVIMEGVQFENNTAIAGSGGAIIAYTSMILITECQFVGNSATSGGALALGNTNTNISRSEFRGNTAFDAGGALGVQLESNIITDNCTFSGNAASRGGIIYTQDSTVTSQNSVMINNIAFTFGAAIHCQGYMSTRITFSLINSTLIHNTVISGGGGIIVIYQCNFTSEGYLRLYENIGSKGLVFVQQGNVSFQGETEIVNNLGSVHAINSQVVFDGVTRFANNTPHVDNYNIDRYPEAGALTLFDSSLYLLGNTTITKNKAENGGAILAIQGNIHTKGVLTILNNTALVSGGGIYAYQSEINLVGLVKILDNYALRSGGGLHIISSTTEFNYGIHKLERNTAQYGGGIYLELNSQVYIIKRIKEKYNCTKDYIYHDPCITDVTEWLRLEFTENSADHGGALYVKDAANSDICASSNSNSNTSYSPTNECFFQTVSLYWNPNTLTTIHVNNTYFQNNSATIRGSNLYGGLLDRCTISPYVEANANEKTQNALQYLQTRSNVELHSISSDPVRVCFCQNGVPDCNRIPPTIEVIKGQTFTISAVTVDQVNHTLTSTIYSLLSSQGGGLSEGESKQNTQENCTDLNYTVLSPYKNEKLILYAEGPCKDIGISNRSVEVKFLPCPIGFALTGSKTHCDCDPALKPYITNCSITTSSLLRNGEVWVQNITNESGYLIYPHCPFDYCFPPTETVTINLNIQHGADSQCSFNRSGIVCGECKTGLSLSLGTNHCRKCSNYWLFLLIPFSLVGITLVGFLMILNLTVAIGTINGLIFYANIIAANRATLLPFKSSNVVTVFIAWLNLDFGFETCFYDGMDAYIKTWLQFVFPLYIIFLVAAIIVISDHSTKFAKLFTRKNPEATLATLILLSYTKILRTIIVALSFVRLNYPDGSHKIVWLLDANVAYLQGKHIPLFIAAVIIALIGLVFTMVLFLWQWIVKFSDKTILLKWTENYKVSCFPDAYHAPFNGKHRYWPGLLLITRTLLYLISAVNVFGDARVNLLAIVCATIFLFLLQKSLKKRVYKRWPIDMLEYTFIVNLTVFAAASFYCRDNQQSQIALAYTSTSIALLTFIAIIIYHAFSFTFKNCTLLSVAREKIKRYRYDFGANRINESGGTNDIVLDGGNFSVQNQAEVLSDSSSLTVVDVSSCSRFSTHDSAVPDDTNTDAFSLLQPPLQYHEEEEKPDDPLVCSDTSPLLDNSS